MPTEKPNSGVTAAEAKAVGDDEAVTDQQDTTESEIRLDDAAQAAIGRQLRTVYSEIVQQPVPDQFLQLLDELERKERG